MVRYDGYATNRYSLRFTTLQTSYMKVPTTMGPCIARARLSASPPGGRRSQRERLARRHDPSGANRLPAARAPPTELRLPAPPRWEAPANCRRPFRSTFTARVSMASTSSLGGGPEIQRPSKTAFSRIMTPPKVIERIELSNICEYQKFLRIK